MKPSFNRIAELVLLTAFAWACARSRAPEIKTTSVTVPAASAHPDAPVAAARDTAPRSRRYWRFFPVPSDSDVRVLVMSDREIVLVSEEVVRVAVVEGLRSMGEVSTFTARTPGGATGCALKGKGSGRAEFECDGQPRYSLVELDPLQDREEIRRIDRQIAVFPSQDEACSRAERCCEAAMPLLLPGKTCDVALLFGPDRSADICVKALLGLRRLLEQSKIEAPADCQ